MRAIIGLAIGAVVLTAAACSGGGKSNSTEATSPPPTAAAQSGPQVITEGQTVNLPDGGKISLLSVGADTTSTNYPGRTLIPVKLEFCRGSGFRNPQLTLRLKDMSLASEATSLPTGQPQVVLKHNAQVLQGECAQVWQYFSLAPGQERDVFLASQ